MIRALFFKEYLKFRWLWWSLFCANVVLMTYIFIDIRHLFRIDHAELVWYRVLHLGQIPYIHLKFAPAITGLLIACIQYLPEMADARLRLSLHLPVPTHSLILGHILAGLSGLLVILFSDLGLLALIIGRYFPSGAVVDALYTAFPWILTGPAAYLGISLALLEPRFKGKVLNVVLAASICGLFLFPAPTAAYSRIIPVLAIPLLLLVPAILLPAYRFRFRKVS